MERCQRLPGWGWPPWQEGACARLSLVSVCSVYLFVCPLGDDHSRGRGETRGPVRALITQDTSPKQSPLDFKATGQRLHLATLVGVTVGLIKYPESIVHSVPPAVNHDYWKSGVYRVLCCWFTEQQLLKAHDCFRGKMCSAVHSAQQSPAEPSRAYGSHVHALHQARLPQTACVDGRTRTPLEQRVRLMQVRGSRAEAVNRMWTLPVGRRRG